MPTDNYGMVVGIFKEETRAEDAIEELKSMGFNDDQISFAAQDDKREMYCIRDTLEDLGVSQEELDYYTSEFETGRSILLIRHEGRRVEALNILFLNGTRSHKYLNVASSRTDGTTPTIGGSKEASQSSSPDNRLQEPSQHEAVATEQEDIESLRRLLKRAGLDHLL